MAVIKRKKRTTGADVRDDITYVSLEDYEGNYNTKKIGIKLDSNKNILELAKEDDDLFLFYQMLLRDDYLFYWHHNGTSYFIKREFISEIWKREDLISKGNLFYTLDEPWAERSSEAEHNNLLVVLSPMPLDKDINSSNIASRTFRTYFPNIQKYLAKNTYILRIMDVNLTYGSLYRNTYNYETMEQDVQDILAQVSEDLAISKNHVYIYGVNEVGTSALYHGVKGGYNSISINPYERLSDLPDDGDTIRFLSNALADNLDDGLSNDLVKNSEGLHYVLTTEGNKPLSKFEGLNYYLLADNYEADDIAKNSTIEQMAILNGSFLDLNKGL